MARALRGAGFEVLGPGGQEADQEAHQEAHVDVHVFVETLNADDLTAIAMAPRPVIAVLNKADLTGFGGDPPMRLARRRAAELQSDTGVGTVALAALLAVAGTDPTVLDPVLLDALRVLSTEPDRVGGAAKHRLATELDVFGTACALSATRAGAGRDAIAEVLYGVSGLGELRAGIDRAAAGTVDRGAGCADYLRRAVYWQRYAHGAHGPVSQRHRARGLDIARDAMRRWAQAGGTPVALP